MDCSSNNSDPTGFLGRIGKCCFKQKNKISKSLENKPIVISNPPVPYTSYIPDGVFCGRRIILRGRVNSSPNLITISLQNGATATDDIPLQLTFKFPENAITRNSRIRTSWGNEMKNGPIEIFEENDFEISIVISNRHQNATEHFLESQMNQAQHHIQSQIPGGNRYGAYLITVNGKKMIPDYGFDYRDMCKINHLVVEGDLTISSIQYDKTESSYTIPMIVAAVCFLIGVIIIMVIAFSVHKTTVKHTIIIHGHDKEKSLTEEPPLLKDNITISDI